MIYNVKGECYCKIKNNSKLVISNFLIILIYGHINISKAEICIYIYLKIGTFNQKNFILTFIEFCINK
jgi:hypothetical protein